MNTSMASKCRHCHAEFPSERPSLAISPATRIPMAPSQPLGFTPIDMASAPEFGDTSAPDFSLSESEDYDGEVMKVDRSMFGEGLDLSQATQNPESSNITSDSTTDIPIPDPADAPFDVDYFVTTQQILPTAEFLKGKKEK